MTVHNPSTKSNLAGCGWHSIYWSAVVYSTSYCWDKATIMLLHKQEMEKNKEKKNLRLNHICSYKVLIAVASSPAELYETTA